MYKYSYVSLPWRTCRNDVTSSTKALTTDINQSICPLCLQSNHCLQAEVQSEKTNTVNVNATASHKTEHLCWCQKTDLVFSDDLLKSIPKVARNKSCICQHCLATQQEKK